MNFTDTGIDGFDVSFYQDDNNTPQGINFATMKSHGADFVIIRAGQGNWIDQDFATNWAGAKEAHIPRAAYWFYDPRVAPLTQAKTFCDLASNPEGRLWIDLEYSGLWGGNFRGASNWRVMCEEVKRRGYRVGIYTGFYWWRENTLPLEREYFGQYPLWLAWYTSTISIVTIPAPWSECLIWQDGTPPIGKLVGVESIEIDHDRFNGGQIEFMKEFGAQVVTPPPPTPPIGAKMNLARTNASNVAICTAPDNNTKTGRVFPANTQFVFNIKQGTWYQLMDMTWLNAGGQNQYITFISSNTPPPVPPPVGAQYAVTLHDYEIRALSRPTYNGAVRAVHGLPETVKVNDKFGFVLLTKPLQFAWYDWCRFRTTQNDTNNKTSFRSLTTDGRAFTNRYGSTTCANYVTGDNLDAEPMRLFPLLCGGAYIKIVGGVGTAELTFETMSSTEDVTQYNPTTHPYLFYSAVNSVRSEIWVDNVNGTKQVWNGKWDEHQAIPFHQFDYKAIVPIIAKGSKTQKIDASLVRLLPTGSPVPSPFVY